MNSVVDTASLYVEANALFATFDKTLACRDITKINRPEFEQLQLNINKLLLKLKSLARQNSPDLTSCIENIIKGVLVRNQQLEMSVPAHLYEQIFEEDGLIGSTPDSQLFVMRLTDPSVPISSFSDSSKNFFESTPKRPFFVCTLTTDIYDIKSQDFYRLSDDDKEAFMETSKPTSTRSTCPLGRQLIKHHFRDLVDAGWTFKLHELYEMSDDTKQFLQEYPSMLDKIRENIK